MSRFTKNKLSTPFCFPILRLKNCCYYISLINETVSSLSPMGKKRACGVSSLCGPSVQQNANLSLFFLRWLRQEQVQEKKIPRWKNGKGDCSTAKKKRGTKM